MKDTKIEEFIKKLKKEFIGIREYTYRDTGTLWGEPCIGNYINKRIDKIYKEFTEKENEKTTND